MKKILLFVLFFLIIISGYFFYQNKLLSAKKSVVQQQNLTVYLKLISQTDFIKQEIIAGKTALLKKKPKL